MAKQLAWGALGTSEDPAETLAREACDVDPPQEKCSRCRERFYPEELSLGFCPSCYEQFETECPYEASDLEPCAECDEDTHVDEHKGDPCPCGWTSSMRKASAIREYVKRERDNLKEQMADDELTISWRRYLQGMDDAFWGMALFLDTQESAKKGATP